MCELFAMSARHPSTVSLSLEEFSRHGGLTGPHKDGWGIAWYDERDVRLVKETHPAASSACVRFIQTNPFSSELVMSHIRRATRGPVASRNCQPFVRELGGAWHCFAHNGDLPGISQDRRLSSERFRPVGETDSEQAFCALMETLRPLWSLTSLPSLGERKQVIAQFAATLRELGPANFLYCDGDALFAHADRRHQNDGSISAPGLWRLARQCPAGGELAAEGLRIASDGGEQEVLLVASVPLTREGWVPLTEGETVVARQGRIQR
ncbi:MAG: class II glutamine amidotransferase [Betaproteobacteria bacterium]|nr:class II glutamine amidotransferase [Betaproteobacteria bacterium]MBI2293323.1 class II glutamine amidotransferase [Betaproteobacteria bacterium]